MLPVVIETVKVSGVQVNFFFARVGPKTSPRDRGRKPFLHVHVHVPLFREFPWLGVQCGKVPASVVGPKPSTHSVIFVCLRTI